jgi:hypothetical protein
MSEKHPWYGPCDAFGPNGECSECMAAYFGGHTEEWEKWLASDTR